MDIRTVRDAVACIKDKIGDECPLVGIILGSGLGKLAELVENPKIIPYKDIPGFPVSTAIGHKGNFIFGELGGKKVVAMQGRFHYYEGYSMDMVTLPVRVMKLLGVEYLFVSNAAGGCSESFGVGDLVIITDHINMMPNPLVGPNMDDFGPRFPDMTCAYDLELQKLAVETAEELGIQVKHGVYLASTGPTYETPAEVRFYKTIGADLLGMSTVPEVIVARHCGLRVFGMSVSTNIANAFNIETMLNDGGDVVKQADRAATKMTALFTGIIRRL